MIESTKTSFPPPYRKSPLRISLIASLVLHVIGVLALRNALPWQWPLEELPTYSVELIRPPVKDLSGEDFSDADIAGLKRDQAPLPEHEQDTISLDTQDERYVIYARIIKDRILRAWRYPPAAKENLIEGKMALLFSLSRDGGLIQVKTVRSSRFSMLDEEAVRAVRAAAPFPPFPERLNLKRLHVKAAFDYRLTSKK